MSPDEPMAIVQVDVQVESPLKVAVISIPVPDGKYLIKNRALDFYWSAYMDGKVYFYKETLEHAKQVIYMQVNENSPIILVFRE